MNDFAAPHKDDGVDHARKMSQVCTEAAELLNRAHEQYRRASTPDSKAFHALKLQMTIFHYEMTLEMSSLLNQKPSGFALKVALKDILHKLVEYERTFSGGHLKKIIDLGERRGFTDARERIREFRKSAGKVFGSIQKYSSVRNKATGHYDFVIENQITAIDSIDTVSNQETVGGFLGFHLEVLQYLSEIGKGRVGGATAA